jgi:DNA-binding NtrC family response regulator
MHNKSILVVECDNSVLESFKDFLMLEGFSVDAARSGREAVEKLNAREYDLALLDMKLLDVEDMKLLSDIQKNTSRTIKIMIDKPVNPESILKFVKKLKQKEENDVLARIKLVGWQPDV